MTSSDNICYCSSSLNVTDTEYKGTVHAGFFVMKLRNGQCYNGGLFLDSRLNSALERTSCNSLFVEGKLIYVSHTETLLQRCVTQRSWCCPTSVPQRAERQERRREGAARGKDSSISAGVHSCASCWDLQQAHQLVPAVLLTFWSAFFTLAGKGILGQKVLMQT